MPTEQVKFALDTDPGEYPQEGNQMLVNCYAEPASKDRGRAGRIKACPGAATTFKDTGDVRSRGSERVGDVLYWLFEENLYKIESDGTQTTVGQIPGTGPVFMAQNDAETVQVAIVPENGFLYILEDDAITLGPVEGYPAGEWVSVCTYFKMFILPTADGEFWGTEFNNGKSIPGLNFANAEARPDKLVAAFPLGDDLLFFGEETTEIYRFDSSIVTGLPLTKTTGFIKKGCLSRYSIKEADNTLFFVGHDRLVYRLNGYTPQRVSNRAVERAIASVSDPETIVGYSYSLEGRLVYGIKHANWCYELNIETGLWSQRKTKGYSTHRISVYVEAFGKVLCGYDTDGVIRELKADDRTEAGREVIFEARSEPVVSLPSNISLDRLDLDILTGRAPQHQGTTSQTDPVVMFRWSRDNAIWSNERHVPLGKRGDYSKETPINRMGMLRGDSNGLTFQLRVSDPHVVSMGTTAQLTYS